MSRVYELPNGHKFEVPDEATEAQVLEYGETFMRQQRNAQPAKPKGLTAGEALKRLMPPQLPDQGPIAPGTLSAPRTDVGTATAVNTPPAPRPPREESLVPYEPGLAEEIKTALDHTLGQTQTAWGNLGQYLLPDKPEEPGRYRAIDLLRDLAVDDTEAGKERMARTVRRKSIEDPVRVSDVVTDPKHAGLSFLENIGPTVSLLPPAALAFYLTGGAASPVLSSLAATAASRPLESAMEGGSALVEAREEGLSDAEARERANKVALANLPLATMDVAQLATVLAPLPAPLKKVIGRLPKGMFTKLTIGAVRSMFSALQEGGEEGLQSEIQKWAKGEGFEADPRLWDKDAMHIGALSGLGFAAPFSVSNAVAESRAEKAEAKETLDIAAIHKQVEEIQAKLKAVAPATPTADTIPTPREGQPSAIETDAVPVDTPTVDPDQLLFRDGNETGAPAEPTAPPAPVSPPVGPEGQEIGGERQGGAQPPSVDRPAAIEGLEQSRRSFPSEDDVKEQKALATGITQEQFNALRDDFLPTDSVTGFEREGNRHPTVKRAQQWIEETGEDAFYIEGDIVNLGGLNAAFGHSGANVHYQGMTAAFKAGLESVAGDRGDVRFIRHGGDEVSAVVVGQFTEDEIAASIDRAQAGVDAYVVKNKLDEVPRKEGQTGPPGSGMYLGWSVITPDVEIADLYRRADNVVEAQKKERANVYRSTAETTGSVASPGQTGRTRSGAQQYEERTGREDRGIGEGSQRSLGEEAGSAEPIEPDQSRDSVAGEPATSPGLETPETPPLRTARDFRRAAAEAFTPAQLDGIEVQARDADRLLPTVQGAIAKRRAELSPEPPPAQVQDSSPAKRKTAAALRRDVSAATAIDELARIEDEAKAMNRLTDGVQRLIDKKRETITTARPPGAGRGTQADVGDYAVEPVSEREPDSPPAKQKTHAAIRREVKAATSEESLARIQNEAATMDRLTDGVQGAINKQREAIVKTQPPPGRDTRADVGEYAIEPTEERSPNRPLPMELPEIVKVAKLLGEGRYPKVREAIRAAGGRARGLFRGDPLNTSIELRADLFEEPEQAARTLAHEIGHWIDYLPDRVLARGNILGHLASLRKYLKRTLEKLPSDAEAALSAEDRTKARRQAKKQARADVGSGNKESLAKVQARIYQELLAQEIESRGLITRDEVMSELKALSRKWKPIPDDADPKYVAYRDSSVELFADAVSVFLNDPALLEQDAPLFFQAFVSRMDRTPSWKRAYLAVQERLREGSREGILDDRTEDVIEMIRKGGVKRARTLVDQLPPLHERIKNGVITFGQQLVERLVNEDAAIVRARKRAEKATGKPIDPERDPVYWLEEEAQSSTFAIWYVDSLNELLLKPAREAGVSEELIGTLLTLERAATERAEIANPLGIGGKHAEEAYEHLVEKIGAEKAETIAEGLKAWREIARTEVINQLEESGAYTEEMIKTMRDSLEVYATFKVQSFIDDEALAKATGYVHRQIGTLQEIGNPLVETPLKDITMARVAHRTSSAVAMVEMFEEALPKEIRPAKTKWNGRYHEPVSTFRKGWGTVTFMQDGKLVGYDVPEGVAEIFDRDPTTSGLAYKSYRILTEVQRQLFIDRNPGYWASNLKRDMEAFAKNVIRGEPIGAAAKALGYSVKAMPDVFQDVFKDFRTPDVDEMLKRRILIRRANRLQKSGDTSEEKATHALLQRYGLTDSGHRRNVREKIGRLFDVMTSDAGAFGERLTKVAAFKYLKDHQEELGLTDRQVAHEVRVLAGSPNFLARGQWYKATNAFFIFSNANVQGWRQSWEAFNARPGEYALKTLVYDVLPTMLKIAIVKGLVGDDDLRKLFMNVSDYDLRNYMIVPLGVTTDGKTVYFRVPHDHTGQLMAGVLWETMTDPQIKEVAHFFNQNIPFSPGSLHPMINLALDFNKYIQGHNPQDEYHGGPVIRKTTFEAGGADSHMAFMRHMWNELGGQVIMRLNSHSSRPKDVEVEIERILLGDSASAHPIMKAALETALEASDAPVLGAIMRRFLKVSDSGDSEAYFDVLDAENKITAQRSKGREDVIYDALREDRNVSTAAIARKLDELGLTYKTKSGLQKRIDQLSARMYGNAYEKSLSYANTKRKREGIEDKHREREGDSR